MLFLRKSKAVPPRAGEHLSPADFIKPLSVFDPFSPFPSAVPPAQSRVPAGCCLPWLGSLCRCLISALRWPLHFPLQYRSAHTPSDYDRARLERCFSCLHHVQHQSYLLGGNGEPGRVKTWAVQSAGSFVLPQQELAVGRAPQSRAGKPSLGKANGPQASAHTRAVRSVLWKEAQTEHPS